MRAYRTRGWYSDITLEGDFVSLVRDIAINVNDKRVELPGLTPENVLFLVCKRWKDQIILAGQGHKSGKCWVWINNEWKDVGITFGVYPCAFNSDILYFVSGVNQYREYDLNTDKTSESISRIIGSQGIRYIDFNQSFDGIVTGDSTYGPQPYDLSQWILRDSLVLGQSYVDGGLGLLNHVYRKFVQGSCEFIRFYRAGNNLAFCSVNQPLNEASFFWMTLEEFQELPAVVSGLENPPVKEPEKPGEPKMPEQKAPNKIETVKRMMRLHPEINTLDEDQRGKILDYFCAAEGGKPWGRKARNKDGSNKNTDAICYLLSDGSFEIYDAISGGDGSATWDYAGIFKNGENGYWAPGEPISNEPVKPTPPVEPPQNQPQPTTRNVFTPRVTYDEMSAFVTKVNLANRETKFGKSNPIIAGRDLYPIQTTAHILWRYFFEHDHYSDADLIQDVKDRGNAEE